MKAATDKRGELRDVTVRDGAPHTLRTSWDEQQGTRTVLVSMVVSYGLHYIAGNRAPYFSVTADGRENNRESFGGCCHDIIAEQFPGALTDLIALHLSDIDGQPMYAEANGWHWLARACEIPERWGPSDKTPDEALEIFASHCRIDENAARQIVRDILAVDPIPWAVKPHAIRRERWARICEGMRPRWKAEADAAIERHELNVYGAKWPK